MLTELTVLNVLDLSGNALTGIAGSLWGFLLVLMLLLLRLLVRKDEGMLRSAAEWSCKFRAGTLPSSFSSFTNLTLLDLSQNKLSGIGLTAMHSAM